MTTLQVRGINQPRLDVPANFRLIVTERHHRNGELVTVQRYQPQRPPFLTASTCRSSGGVMVDC
ncbi:hypothetical protein [Lacticaseibacillus nasuensis]|uniref:hypothetical protein n=1 Tax=Lacticaseibacillus nasuensis TaxID=944671 RepID=UPI0006D1D6D2|nr:hypothetical protein [Lacticaseibacillus nasuensis]